MKKDTFKPRKENYMKTTCEGNDRKMLSNICSVMLIVSLCFVWPTDESMGIIYGGGTGAVYQELVEWLTSELEDLQIAGALAMGNFARSG